MLANLKRIFIVFFLFITATVFAAGNGSPNSFSPAQVKNIQQIVHDYLLAKPEILVQAWQVLQQREEAKQQQTANKAIKDNFKAIFYDKDNPVAGNPKGSVSLVEFFDYQCVHCRNVAPVLKKLIKKNKNLRVVFKDWPIFGGNSILAAKAAFAANLQGKYLPYHNLLLKAKPPLDNDNIMQLAKKLGLNLVKFKKDMALKRWDDVLKDNADLAAKLKLVGTPAFVIANRSGSKTKFIPGLVSAEVFNDIIKAMGSKKQ